MSDDFSDLINNVKHMIDSGNIPEDMKNIINNYNSSNLKQTGFSNTNNKDLDIEKIIKMKKIIDSMSQSNDARANLLQSLKPYLRDNRKEKLDQYVNLLNVSKIIDMMNNDKKGHNGNA